MEYKEDCQYIGIKNATKIVALEPVGELSDFSAEITYKGLYFEFLTLAKRAYESCKTNSHYLALRNLWNSDEPFSAILHGLNTEHIRFIEAKELIQFRKGVTPVVQPSDTYWYLNVQSSIVDKGQRIKPFQFAELFNFTEAISQYKENNSCNQTKACIVIQGGHSYDISIKKIYNRTDFNEFNNITL